MSLKKRFIAGFLTFATVLSLLPAISIVSPTKVEAVDLPSLDKSEVFVYEAGELDAKGMQLVVDSKTTKFEMSLWHYSGGYWARSNTDPNRVYDSEFRKSKGNVANAEDAFTANGINYGLKTFEYTIPKDSELAKAIDAGDNVYVEISPASKNPDVTLTKLFNFPVTKNPETGKNEFAKNEDGSIKGYSEDGITTKSPARIVKEDGYWKIKFDLPVKMNIYDERELNFGKFTNKEGKTFGLTKYIPIPKLGYGWIMYSMFPRNGGTIQNNGNLPGRFWFADENSTDYNAWRYGNIDERVDNAIHPDMIMHSSAGNNGGLLYPGYTIKLYRDEGKLVDSNQYKIGLGTFASAGAVGMFFDYSLNLKIYSKPKTKVIASYVEVVDVDADGNPVYKTVFESERLTDVRMSGTNVLPDAAVAKIDNGDGWVGYLNDVVTSPKDLGDPSTIKWENELTPKSTTDKIQANARDVDYYKFGILTHEYNGDNVIESVFSSSVEVKYKMKDPQKVESILNSFGVYSFNAFMSLSPPIRGVIWGRVAAANTGNINSGTSMLGSNLYIPMEVEEIGKTVYTAKELDNPYVISTESLKNVSDAFNETGNNIKDTINNNNRKSGNLLDTVNVDNRFAGPDNDVPEGEEVSTPGEIQESDIIQENVVYLRYVCIPNIIQRNRIHIVEGGVEIGVFATDDVVGLENDNGVTADVIFNDITQELEEMVPDGEVTLNEWVTSDDDIEDLINNPIPSTGTHTGTSIPNIIPDVPKTEDVYADWTVEINIIGTLPKVAEVPQWRLSLHQPEFDEWRKAYMWLTFSGDSGCYAASSYITPSGTYRYNTVNPNEKITSATNDPANQKLYHWLHSKALTRGTYSISHDRPLVSVDMNGTMTMIKSTQDSSLQAASWATDSGTKTGLLAYDIQTSTTPKAYTGGDTYYHSDTLDYGLSNIDTYTHYKGVHGGHTRRTGCRCKLVAESVGVHYIDAEYNVGITFERYKPINTDSKKLTVSPEIKVDNGLTTLKYQLKDTLTVYPEIGMLFDNDSNQESIKWVVGDQARKINPVVWQTLEHKVYVVPTSSGTSVATDSRAITKAQSLGESGKQVIHKGAGVNTTFQLFRDEDKDTKSILTVKTFALDFASSSSKNASTLLNGVDVKSAWGNSAYNSQAQHDKLIAELKKTGKADATEKLLVDIDFIKLGAEYTGAEKKQKTANYKVMTYSGKEVTTFEHQLIVRGGSLIAVGYNDRSNASGALKWYTPTQLKTVDEPLYNALIGMNLYNESGDRNKTVFSTFEHLTGDSLTEDAYATSLESARNQRNSLLGASSITTPDASKVVKDKGWYSEDTTVLVIKEYVTNFEVPSISFGDKLSMTVGSLTTPIDKSQFYSQMGKGYTYLEYDLKFGSVYDDVDGSSAKFEFTSLPIDAYGFGQQKTDYLVPNVSITDTTRLY